MTDYNKIALFTLSVVIIEAVALGLYAYESISYANHYVTYTPICVGGNCGYGSTSSIYTVKSTTTVATTTVPTTTIVSNSYCATPLTILHVGNSLSCSGFSVTLANVTPWLIKNVTEDNATLSLYYAKAFVGNQILRPGTSYIYQTNSILFVVHVNQTYYSTAVSQRWATVNISTVQ